MRVSVRLFRVMADRRGSGAAEFALILPLLLTVLFVIIDVGRLFYVVNEAEKATQMGARFAIVTDTIPAKIAAADYVGSAVCDADNNGVYEACIQGGAIKDPAALGSVTCTSASCVGTGSYPANTAMNVGAFTRLVDKMATFDPFIAATNVSISFRGSGIGFAGDPTGMDIVPLVTVTLSGLKFRPITFLSLVALDLPDARTTLSAESSAGIQSN